MAPVIQPVATAADFPARTTVVVIGAGIVGLSAALTLAERGIPVVVLEKGRVAAEQSSRNLGWVRKTTHFDPERVHSNTTPWGCAADPGDSSPGPGFSR